MIDWKPIDGFKYIDRDENKEWLFCNRDGAHVGFMWGELRDSRVVERQECMTLNSVTHFAEINLP